MLSLINILKVPSFYICSAWLQLEGVCPYSCRSVPACSSRRQICCWRYTASLGNIIYNVTVQMKDFCSPVTAVIDIIFSYWSQHSCSRWTVLARPSPCKSECWVCASWAAQWGGRRCFGCCSVSLQGSQETESETCLWKLGSCHIFISLFLLVWHGAIAGGEDGAGHVGRAVTQWAWWWWFNSQIRWS